MQIPGRDFAGGKRRGIITCCFSANFLLATVFLGNRLQETGASQQTLSIRRQQKSSLPFESYDNLTEDEKRSVVTFEYNIQHINSSNGSNVLMSIYLKTREVIVRQLNKETPNTANATAVATTTTTTTTTSTTTTTKDYDKTSVLASTTATTTTTPPKTIPVITLIITLPRQVANGRRRRRGIGEEVTFKEDDLHFVEYDPEILDLDLRISIFIRRKDVSHRIQRLHQIVHSPEFRSALQTEVQQAQVVRIYPGMPVNVSMRNSSSRPSSKFRSLWISIFFYIIHTLCSVDMLNIR